MARGNNVLNNNTMNKTLTTLPSNQNALLNNLQKDIQTLSNLFYKYLGSLEAENEEYSLNEADQSKTENSLEIKITTSEPLESTNTEKAQPSSEEISVKSIDKRRRNLPISKYLKSSPWNVLWYKNTFTQCRNEQSKNKSRKADQSKTGNTNNDHEIKTTTSEPVKSTHTHKSQTSREVMNILQNDPKLVKLIPKSIEKRRRNLPISMYLQSSPWNVLYSTMTQYKNSLTQFKNEQNKNKSKKENHDYNLRSRDLNIQPELIAPHERMFGLFVKSTAATAAPAVPSSTTAARKKLPLTALRFFIGNLKQKF